MIRAVVVALALALSVSAACLGREAAPTEKDVEAGIRASWVRPAEAGKDGAMTVEISKVQIGRPRPWNILDGGDGRPENSVWPVRVQWRSRTHYHSRTAVVEYNSVFSVHRNGLNEWVVGLSSDPGQSSRSYDEPATAGGR